MRNSLLKFIYLLTPQFVFAQGGLSTSCEVANNIRNPVGGQGYYMSSDCRTAYVLPPANGKVEVNGRTLGDLSRCKDVKNLSKALQEISSQMKHAVEAQSSEEDLNKLIEKRRLILGQYNDLAKSIGASIELIFSMNTIDIVSKYEYQNQGLGVSFRPISLKEVKLNWNNENEVDPDLQIAFNKSLPVMGDANIGNGSFAARLDLSLFGACQLRDPFTKEIPDKIKFQNVAGLITPNVTYKYEVAATYQYEAKFNRGALASQIRNSSTSGGLFTTSSASSLIARSESSSWFGIDMNCDDSRVCDQAKVETSLQIKQRLVDEVLEGIMLAKIGVPAKSFETPEPPNNGASVASEALRKECQHVYCKVGAVLLDVGSAVFGGKSKTDTYISTNSHWSSEKVDIKTPVSFYGIMGFKK